MAEPTSRYIPNRTPCGRSRREFLWQVGGGFAGLGLIDLLSRDGFFERQARAEEKEGGTPADGRRICSRPSRRTSRRRPSTWSSCS
jgi:hypothetical protein